MLLCYLRVTWYKKSYSFVTFLVLITCPKYLYIPVQTPRYKSLKQLLSDILQHFLTYSVPMEKSSDVAHFPAPNRNALAQRMKELQEYLDGLPRNKEDKERLLSSGYSSLLWEEVSELEKHYIMKGGGGGGGWVGVRSF